MALDAVIEADAIAAAIKRDGNRGDGNRGDGNGDRMDPAAIATVARAEALTRAVIDVDDFAPEELRRRAPDS